MGMIFAGIVSAIVIAIGASYYLRSEGQHRLAWEVYSSPSTRVADPGDNLVGPAWTGEGEVGAEEAPEAPAS
jgi:hypothetical protein